ncbi:MAG: MarR family winged helix-turn-helix transcriptional regulator [Candidatus Acidiferrales bacterium]
MSGSIPELPCLCASFRRASRALTQIYDAAVRPLGLRVTQFTILQALALTGEVPQNRLGGILALDSTTLTRTLAIMGRRGWVAEKRGRDGRERLLSLTKAGRGLLGRASVPWQEVQDRVRARLGVIHWQELFDVNRKVTMLARGGAR